MERREIFAGNWKMYTSHAEALELARGIISGVGAVGTREVVVFPPSLHVRDVVNLCKGTPVNVGVQNMYFEKEGAFTGEISPAMVKDAGARFCLIGHSERRHVFGETDELVNKKVLAGLEWGLEPMVCVGELLEERDSGRGETVVRTQVEKAFAGLTGQQMKTIVIAYEPVWAIGTGKVATPEMAEAMHCMIRKVLTGLFGSETAESMPILYGGSVKPDNIKGLYCMPNIDGVLVGGASLKAPSFLDIVHAG
jgi:triosephosphate isomerase (TIM)